MFFYAPVIEFKEIKCYNYFMRFNFKKWKYVNITILLLSIVLFYFFSKTGLAKNLILEIGKLGYFGALIVGIFFVSIYTITPASVALFYLAENHNLLLIAFCAGVGAMLGDYIILRFLKDKVYKEIKSIFNINKKTYLNKLFQTPYFAWLLPVIGAIIIASPLPDEIGIAMMGLSRVKHWQFLILTFLLNALGILAIIGFTRIF